VTSAAPPPGPAPAGRPLPPPLRLAEATLVSVAQVDLQGNIWTGVLILAGIFAKGWTTGVFALLGTVSAIACAQLLGADRESITEGLQGFSGCLTGIALVLMLGDHPWTWVLTVLAGAACSLVTAALTTLLSGWRITGLTAPFCLVSGAVLLAAPGFTRLTYRGAAAALPTAARGATGLSWHDLWHGFFTGIAQVFLLDTWYSGVLMLAGLFLAGLRVGLFTVAGSLTGWALGAPSRSAWVIATAIEATVGFRSPDSYAEVPDADRELAYDFRTVQEVGGLAAAVPGGTDRERLDAIRALVRERDADR